MGRKPIGSESSRWSPLILVFLGLLCCTVVGMFISTLWRPLNRSRIGTLANLEDENGYERDGCCRGIEKMELWGYSVKWGSKFKLNSSQECCKACKAMCGRDDGPCLCDSWVFCGNKVACGERFGECWLKKQKDTLTPDEKEEGDNFMWTSGLVFGKREGIVKLETEYGALHIKLLPDCSPRSVKYLLDLLWERCVGCHFYRAESRSQSWDVQGNHIQDASFGPPFALIQGTLAAERVTFNKIPSEFCPTVRRGSVAWVGSGPEFFISLANHVEWQKSYTVFGSVLPEDMAIADKIADLPTRSDNWHGINVSLLEKPVPLIVQRIQTSQGDINLNTNVVSN